tara:strand:+ start:393 stop:596 length:204 start_codon:yes stop_codon:yes gene_type:complete
MAENWQILLAIIIVGLSIVMPIYYSYQKKIEKQKVEQALKHGREVAESEKIRVYLNQINEKFRKKRK